MSAQHRTVLEAIEMWVANGQPVALATAVASTGSAPRGLGAQLAVTGGGVFAGGLSGGCAEVGIVTAAVQLLAADDLCDCLLIELGPDGCEVGPQCGSVLTVLVERVDDELLDHLRLASSPEASRLGSRQRRQYSGSGRNLHRESVNADVGGDQASTRWSTVDTGFSLELDTPPALRLVLGGGGDVAAELILLARRLGWRTLLIDPRTAFANRTAQVAEPDELAAAWPDAALAAAKLTELDACVALAHDEKLDLPFLEHSLLSAAVYVGAIGSRAAQRERRDQLAPLVGERIENLYGPAGLNLGGSSAAEIALSIAAEVTAVVHGRHGGALSRAEGSITATALA